MTPPLRYPWSLSSISLQGVSCSDEDEKPRKRRRTNSSSSSPVMLKEVAKVSPPMSKNITVPVSGSPKMGNIMQSIANSLPPHLSPVKITFTKPTMQTTNTTTQKVSNAFSCALMLPWHIWSHKILKILSLTPLRWSSWPLLQAPILCPTSCPSLTLTTTPPWPSWAPPPSWPRPPINRRWSSQPARAPPPMPTPSRWPQSSPPPPQWSCRRLQHVGPPSTKNSS